MSTESFVHLRVHSAYSLSEGAIRLDELASLCCEHRMPAVAVTDTHNLFGAMEFALVARKKGIQPIIGCQIDVADDDAERHFRSESLRRRSDRLVLLVQNEAGYRNLMRLVSEAYLSGEQGDTEVTLEQIEACSGGLICLSGGPDGPLGRLLDSKQTEDAEHLCGRLAEIFPGRFYIELQRHGLEVEQRIEERLIDLAYARDLPLVATNDAYFARREQFRAHDTLLCIEGKVLVADQDRRRLTEDHCFRSPGEMRDLFSDLPEAVDNTLVIARRCAFIPEPASPILPPFKADGYDDEATLLRHMARQGLEKRLAQMGPRDDAPAEQGAWSEPYRARLDYELDVIQDMGFPGYFLIVADFVQWAKGQGIPVGPGRGSGAGSVVAWSLAITDLDPLRFGLLFERFLNPERVSMPDFDIDFCQDRRDEVVRYVQERYGSNRVAQIITFGELKARAVLRSVGRALGMPLGQVDRIAKLVPHDPARPVSLQQAIDGVPELQQLRGSDDTVEQLFDTSLELEGLYHHVSTHAAGVIIGDRPLIDLVPLYRDVNSDKPVTQFSMKYVEMAGLVKFDFLGLKTLTVLAKAQDMIRERGGEIDFDTLALDDAATYETLGRGDTVGIFQLESAGMRDTLKRLRPDSFEDIIALVSLYRPGPMDNIPRYIACKHGQEQPDYMLPQLKPILEDTFGVMIYQEQVMEVARTLSGYTLGQADLLRRAMGKKIQSEMDAQRGNFVSGAVARGVSERDATQIFDQVSKFAEYGFNKSHAASYAMIGYQTAWMKTHHPLEFFAASMTLETENTDKLNVFRQDMSRLGVRLLPPDINRSREDFSVEDGEDAENPAVRYALAAIRNVNRVAISNIVQERDANGPFTGIGNFAARIGTSGVKKSDIENLACAGAFDSLESNRCRLYEGAEAVIRLAASGAAEAEEKELGQSSLLEAFGEDLEEEDRLRLPETSDWAPMERLNREFAAIGGYLSAHPLASSAQKLKDMGIVSANSIDPEMAGRTVRVAGVVISRQERTSRKGSRYAFRAIVGHVRCVRNQCFFGAPDDRTGIAHCRKSPAADPGDSG